MRSTLFFVAATSFASFAYSTPLDRRFQACTAPLQWHVCGDGWAGCCSESPCKGPGVESSCPSGNPTPDTPIVNPQIPYTSTTTAVATATPTSLPDGTGVEPDRMWTERCKEDNSNCNWNTTYYSVSPYLESWSYNTTGRDVPQFHVAKDTTMGYERQAIAHFQGIPDHVKKCRISSYKPWVGAYWGVGYDGAIKIANVDLGDKTFKDATGGKTLTQIKYLKSRVDTGDLGTVDFGNGRMRRGFLDNSLIFDCPKSEVVLHFSLGANMGDVIFDQVAKPPAISKVQRSGWVLIYEG